MRHAIPALPTLLFLAAGCGTSATTGAHPPGWNEDFAVPDDGASAGDDLAAPPGSDGGGAHGDGGGGSCADPGNLAGCGCDTPGAMRACYTGSADTRGKGTCHDGMQACIAGGEFSAWGPCTGDALPGVEAGHCMDGVDNDCNGLVDCKDAACIHDPSCTPMMECAPGSTRPCYDGPQGSAGVGQCKAGSQTCDQTGHWGAACAGEVLPGQELFNCADNIDNDCNGLTDCKDVLACFLDPRCAANACNPGDTQSCYSGPQGTQGVGICKAGMQTCAQDGKSWGPCMGEVDPGMEGGHCNDGLDNDCNGVVDCQDPACLTAPNCCVPAMGNVDGTIYAHSPTTLYTVDPNNWNVTTIGDFTTNEQITDLAVTPDGHLYVISFSNLYSVDPANAQTTLLAAVGGMGNNSLTFLPDGTLIAADSSGEVKTIDPKTGNVTDLGNFGNSLSSSGDLVAIRDGTMYGVSTTAPGGADASADNWLIRVDVKTGKATPVGPTGFGDLWGLAFANSRLIGFTNSGEIVLIDPQTGKGAQVANKGIPFWGAGTSPLVQANTCP